MLQRVIEVDRDGRRIVLSCGHELSIQGDITGQRPPSSDEFMDCTACDTAERAPSMTVWVVTWAYEWEVENIVGVFDNEALARAELARREALPKPVGHSRQNPWDGSITPYELNQVDKSAPDYLSSQQPSVENVDDT